MHGKQNTNVFFDRKIKARVLAIFSYCIVQPNTSQGGAGTRKPERKVKFERKRKDKIGERQQQFERNFGSPLRGLVCTGELSNQKS